MGLGAAGIGILSMIVAIPIAISAGGAALGTRALTVIAKQVNKRLELKMGKHEKIRMLADAKLDIIRDYVSKALEDDLISDVEHSLILTE